MRRAVLLPGALLALVGVALSARFTFAGPAIPETPLGWIGWGLLLLGLLEMKVADAMAD